jgi:hypothetical protein
MEFVKKEDGADNKRDLDIEKLENNIYKLNAVKRFNNLAHKSLEKAYEWLTEELSRVNYKLDKCEKARKAEDDALTAEMLGSDPFGWAKKPHNNLSRGRGKQKKGKKKNISSIYKMGSCSASEENFASVPLKGGRRRRRRRSRRRRPRRTKKRKSKSRKKRRTVRKRRRKRRR